MSAEKEGYDQTVSLYSPEGRIYQVEYAREASRRGSVALAIRFRNGVLIAAHKGRRSNLLMMDKIDKIHPLGDNIVVVTSGLISDSRILVDYLRELISINHMTFGGDVGIHELATELGEALWIYSEYGNVRPFGVSMLLVGPKHVGDRIPTIYTIDVMGSFYEHRASAIGHGYREVNELFEKEYKSGMSENSAKKLAEKALRKVVSSTLAEHVIDLCIVQKDSYKLGRWDLK